MHSNLDRLLVHLKIYNTPIKWKPGTCPLLTLDVVETEITQLRYRMNERNQLTGRKENTRRTLKTIHTPRTDQKEEQNKETQTTNQPHISIKKKDKYVITKTENKT